MGNIALAKKFQIKQRIQLRPLKMLAVKFFPAPKELKNTESIKGVQKSTDTV